jgi:hypothetical protein
VGVLMMRDVGVGCEGVEVCGFLRGRDDAGEEGCGGGLGGFGGIGRGVCEAGLPHMERMD